MDPTGICITDDRVGERDVAKLLPTIAKREHPSVKEP